MSTRPLRSPLDADSPIRHRPPILCIDRIREVGAEAASCSFDVREGPHVAGGLMWEGGLVEGLAQTSTLLEPEDAAEAEGVGMLVGIRRFTIRRQPRVGERVLFSVELIRRLGPFLLVNGRASSKGELLAEGELKFYWDTQGPSEA